MCCERYLYITVKEIMLTSKPQKIAKVVICGMKSVGKTTILEQLIYGNITLDSVSVIELHSNLPNIINRILIEHKLTTFPKKFHETIEDTYVASVDTDRGVRDILRIYDTAGLQGSVQVNYYLHNANHIDN